MRRGASTVKQTGSRQQHGAGADGADSPNSSGDSFQRADHFSTYLIILNRGPTGYEQGVDVSAQLAKSFVCGDSQTTIRDKGGVRGSSHDFNRIDWWCARILPDENFRRPSKDLQRSNQVEDLSAGRSHENHSARCARRTLIHRFITLIVSRVLPVARPLPRGFAGHVAAAPLLHSLLDRGGEGKVRFGPHDIPSPLATHSSQAFPV